MNELLADLALASWKITMTGFLMVADACAAFVLHLARERDDASR